MYRAPWGQGSGGSTWDLSGWVLAARTHLTLQIGTGKPGQSHPWAPDTSLGTRKRWVQTMGPWVMWAQGPWPGRVRPWGAEEQPWYSTSGTGADSPGGWDGVLGHGQVRGDPGVGQGEKGLWMLSGPWQPKHAVPSHKPLPHWLSCSLLPDTPALN